MHRKRYAVADPPTIDLPVGLLPEVACELAIASARAARLTEEARAVA
jgi:hypothetical protein